MNAIFENSNSLEYNLSKKHLFYCFYNGTVNEDLPVTPHWHYYIEIISVTKGSGLVILNGHTITMTKGDMVFILPQDVHAIYQLDDLLFEYAVIKCDPAILFDDSFEGFMFKNIIPVIKPIEAHYKLTRSKDMIPEIKSYISTSMTLFEERPFGYEFVLKSNILLIFNHMIQTLNAYGFNMIDYNDESSDIKSILPAFVYIQEHFNTNITAEDVAKHCHLSYSYFSRLFKKISGISFTSYLNFTRINEAERLLLSQQLTVTEISYAVGFNDTSYFIRQFKSFKKMTPKQFLKFIHS